MSTRRLCDSKTLDALSEDKKTNKTLDLKTKDLQVQITDTGVSF